MNDNQVNLETNRNRKIYINNLVEYNNTYLQRDNMSHEKKLK